MISQNTVAKDVAVLLHGCSSWVLLQGRRDDVASPLVKMLLCDCFAGCCIAAHRRASLPKKWNRMLVTTRIMSQHHRCSQHGRARWIMLQTSERNMVDIANLPGIAKRAQHGSYCKPSSATWLMLQTRPQAKLGSCCKPVGCFQSERTCCKHPSATWIMLQTLNHRLSCAGSNASGGS